MESGRAKTAWKMQVLSCCSTLHLLHPHRRALHSATAPRAEVFHSLLVSGTQNLIWVCVFHHFPGKKPPCKAALKVPEGAPLTSLAGEGQSLLPRNMGQGERKWLQLCQGRPRLDIGEIPSLEGGLSTVLGCQGPAGVTIPGNAGKMSGQGVPRVLVGTGGFS